MTGALPVGAQTVRKNRHVRLLASALGKNIMSRAAACAHVGWELHYSTLFHDGTPVLICVTPLTPEPLEDPAAAALARTAAAAAALRRWNATWGDNLLQSLFGAARDALLEDAAVDEDVGGGGQLQCDLAAQQPDEEEDEEDEEAWSAAEQARLRAAIRPAGRDALARQREQLREERAARWAEHEATAREQRERRMHGSPAWQDSTTRPLGESLLQYMRRTDTRGTGLRHACRRMPRRVWGRRPRRRR